MYPGNGAAKCADKPAFFMAATGEAVTYAELEARSCRLARLLRARGLCRLDHYAIFMENNARYIESCSAGSRAGLYYTCVNSFLMAGELAYILNNSESKILITSEAKSGVALAALASCPKIELCLIVDGRGDGGRVQNLDEATAPHPATPLADEIARCRDALLVRYHRAAKGNSTAVADAAGFAAAAALRFPGQALAIPRRHDLSLAGSALSFGAAGGGEFDDRPRRHRDHHGELRRGAVSATGGDLQGDAQPVGPDHVLAPAQVARRGPAPLRSILPRNCGARRGALSGTREGRDDCVVGADHSRILRRNRGIGLCRLRQRANGWPIRGRSARCCSASFTCSTPT